MTSSTTPRLLPALAVLAAACAMPGAASAFTDAQQQACAPDALKLCSDTIPDIPKTTACMRAHLPQLSPACRTAFNAATGGGTATASMPARERQAERVSRRPSRAMAAGGPMPGRRVPPPVGGAYPPYPGTAVAGLASPPPISIDGLATLGTTRGSLAYLCRQGLIDSYTCTVTAPALGLAN